MVTYPAPMCAAVFRHECTLLQRKRLYFPVLVYLCFLPLFVFSSPLPCVFEWTGGSSTGNMATEPVSRPMFYVYVYAVVSHFNALMCEAFFWFIRLSNISLILLPPSADAARCILFRSASTVCFVFLMLCPLFFHLHFDHMFLMCQCVCVRSTFVYIVTISRIASCSDYSF